MVAAEFHNHVDVFAVFEDVIELDDVAMAKCLVYFNLGDQLSARWVTFCLAFDFLRVYLLTILIADTFLVSMFSTSKHFANPPLPKKRRLMNFRTTPPPLVCLS